MTLNLLYCLIGFVLLYYGAGWLVRGSSSLARSLGVAPIVIGLTVVAFGTSAPELVVSLVSSIKGNSMIAVGNVIGSNICNIALVLGLAAVFQPIACGRFTVRRDIPIMVLITAGVLALCMDSGLGRVEGAALLIGIVVYTVMNYRFVQGDSGSTPDVDSIAVVTSRAWQLLLILVGIGGVVGGAELVVTSAVEVMKVLGVGEKFIGLTIVAFGTSLPELATSVVAAVRKEMDISIGNLVGSNVFNLLSVLGAASLVRPIPIPDGFFESGLAIDGAVMLLVSALPWLLMRRSPTLTRPGGVLLLCCYVGYVGYLIATR